MVSPSERADYKQGVHDRKQGKVNPIPRSDAYYKGVFGEPLEEGKSSGKRAWGIALAFALPVSLFSYMLTKRI